MLVNGSLNRYQVICTQLAFMHYGYDPRNNDLYWINNENVRILSDILCGFYTDILDDRTTIWQLSSRGFDNFEIIKLWSQVKKWKGWFALSEKYDEKKHADIYAYIKV